ncbi:MAG: MaoC family dehydratase [Vulcanimicrobiaceae bacterium]
MGSSGLFFVGQSSRLTRPVTAAVVEAFAAVSTDDNPLHLDEAYAATTRFGKRVAHGMLAAAYISAMMGTQFPGPGTIYMSQSLKFVRPVFLDDVLEVVATVTDFREDDQVLTIATVVSNQDGKVVVSGEARCLVSDVLALPALA